MTRISSRMPKKKEVEVIKGSTPGVARELDFVSKTESIIYTSTKMKFSQPLTFDHIVTSIGSKIVLPH
jgi:hypothetical protein